MIQSEGLNPIDLILRAAGGGVSKDEGAFSALWNLLRDATSWLLRMRSERYEPDTQDEVGVC